LFSIKVFDAINDIGDISIGQVQVKWQSNQTIAKSIGIDKFTLIMLFFKKFTLMQA